MAKQRDFPSAIAKLITEAERNKDIDKYDQALDYVQRTLNQLEFKTGTTKYKKSPVFRRWVDNTTGYWDELLLRITIARNNLAERIRQSTFGES